MNSRSRQNVTWRVGELSEQESINKWIDEQKNIQSTLTTLALHMIDRFGYRNITDHDIQKVMYHELLIGPLPAAPDTLTVTTPAPNRESQAKPITVDPETRQPAASKSTRSTRNNKSDPEEANQSKDPDDELFNQVDSNNL